MTLKNLKRPLLVIVVVASTITGFAQNKKSLTPAASSGSMPAHYPKQKTEANYKSWASQYPEEAKVYTEDLWQRMSTQNQSTPAEQQKYDEMKQEYMKLSPLVPGSHATKRSAPNAK